MNIKISGKIVANELAISESSDMLNEPGKGSMNTRKQLNSIKISILPPGVPKSNCVTR